MDTNSPKESRLGAAIGGTVFCVLAVVALILASRASDGGFTLFATLLFAFCVVMVFGLISRHVGVGTKRSTAVMPQSATASHAEPRRSAA